LQRTVDAVNKKEMGWLRASKSLAFHRLRFVGEPGKENIHGVSKGLGRFQAAFDQTLERELVGRL
jgi:hypothetical protein